MPEIYTSEKDAHKIISVAENFGVDARIVGRVETSEKKELQILTGTGKLTF